MWRRLCLVDCLLIDFNSGAQSMTHSISGNIGNKKGSTYQNEILGHIFPLCTNVLLRLRKEQNHTLHVCTSEEHVQDNAAEYNWRIFIPQYVHISKLHYFSIPYIDLAYKRLSELLKKLLLITSSRMIICSWPCGPLCLGGSCHDIEPKETLTGQLSSNETHMRLKFASFPQISPRLFCQLVKVDIDLRKMNATNTGNTITLTWGQKRLEKQHGRASQIRFDR